MGNFVNAMKKETNFTNTENGAVALKSTNSSLVDLFGSIGALRPRNATEIENLFIKAFYEDRLLTTKLAFYARNIRGGLGERNTFKVILKYMAINYPEIIRKNLKNILLFGRADDLYTLVGTPVEENMWSFIREQWVKDISDMNNNKPISLLGKWLKSVNTSSTYSIRLGKLTASKLGLTEKIYRKTLSSLRSYIDVVEKKMSAQNWTDIKYGQVPSKAMSIYRKAFGKHDFEGFTTYIENVTNGKEKINASTLFPYDIMLGMNLGWYGSTFSLNNDKVLEAQWNALPNYVEGENNILIMADTSGSMRGRPIATSIGLAMYFAERNHGIFKDIFMTFSERPSFVQLKGNTLQERIRCVPDIVSNTNLESAFNLILSTAIENKLKYEDMPKSLVVISDMEFDGIRSYVNNSRKTWHDIMVDRFNLAGYEMPNIIYWNVESRHDNFQVTSDYKGVQLASGQSPSVFKSILKNIGANPYEAMVNTLSDPMYDCVVI